MEQRLSDYLLGQIALYDMDGVNRPSERDQEARFYLERIAEEIIAAREGFTDEKFAILEKALQNEPEITECEIDRVLTCRSLQEVPEMVRRLTKMSKLTAMRIPSSQTAIHIKEATRTYVCGFFQASAAMSRAALEQSIKEQLGQQGTGIFIGFQELLNDARKWNVLSPTMGEEVRRTAKKADRVLHEAPTDEGGAFEVQLEVRGFLEMIYSVNGGF